ncbi:hypothetical protein [Nitrosomonas sp. Nm34]|uniref:hypothetical protein n=1 Tax=Nitrosomonas sp. Nm34 TaxID=1881055 RepID=UPI0008E1E118|nr:hypothetical protein [Nitrosomonas sp. Nm34]SFJ01511.1 hypothetical protein SAMN05428978_10826 [Nitrosomonas sp. Nm34]
MRVLVLNAKRTHGLKKADGKPYEMYELTVALPLRPVAQGNYNMEGFGYDVASLPLDPAAFQKFAPALTQPRILELIKEPMIMFGELKDTVIGFNEPK